ncbi:tRNA (adenine-N1)-methyltransferase [Nanoarchaeota archaeon]
MIKKILQTKQGKKIYVEDINKEVHTKYGLVKAVDMQEAKDGSTVFSNRHEECYVYSPSFIDQYKRMKRLAQIMTLKDICYIIALTGVGKESKVVEAGAGSGAVSTWLARYVKKVYSYENNEDNLLIAKENIKRLGFKNIELKKGDVYEKIEAKNTDLVIFDLPEPWRAIENAAKSLKVGGFLVSYSPNLTSALDFNNALEKNNKFFRIKTAEIVEHEYEVIERKCRPKSKVMHTGFMTLARKIKK